MPWCPVCKEEYKEGSTLCPDCNAELVDSLEEIKDEAFTDFCSFEDEILAKKFSEYLIYSGVPAAFRHEEKDKNFVVSVDAHDVKKAKKHFSAFYAVETAEALNHEINDLKEANETGHNKEGDPLNWDRTEESTPAEQAEEAEFPEDIDPDFSLEETEDASSEELKEALEEIVYSSSAYEKKSDKARDLFSTSLVFGIFGVAGIVLIVLNALGVISFFSGLLFYLVAGILFVGFIVVAIQSMLSYKKAKADAVLEEQLTKSLMDWLEQNYTLETKNEFYAAQSETFPDMTEEIKYLRMTQDIKSRLVEQFGEIDDAYLDYIIENYCNRVFATESL